MNPGQMNLPFKDDASSRSANLLCKLILVELALFLTVGVLSIFWKDWKTVSLLTFATRGFNNEVQHLEKQEGGWYSK